ncbi:MAG TPA: hypothetical protein VJK05_05410 [archaeon]|nr:hypothetical protein [archaeon]
MASYSELQKRIALLLLHEAKTAPELNKQLNIPYSQLMDELKGMLKLQVVSKEGFPTYFKLNKDITEKVIERRKIASDDSNKLRLNVIIEAKSIDKDLLQKQLERIIKALEEDKDFKVYDISQAEPAKDGDKYSGYIEANLSLKDFRSVTKLIFYYGPTSLEIIKPEKLEIKADDLQDSLIDMIDIMHGYSDFIGKAMNAQELDEFRKKILNQ